MTRVINSLGKGPGASRRGFDDFPTVYQELKKLAHAQLNHEAKGGGRREFQTTTVVSEACLKLLGRNASWDSRGHFFGAAARAMRHILVDAARRRKVREKHAPNLARAAASDSSIAPGGNNQVDLLALDTALSELEIEWPHLAEIVTLRFFAGLTIAETASALGVDPKTVRNRWDYARAWLYRRMNSCADGNGRKIDT